MSGRSGARGNVSGGAVAHRRSRSLSRFPPRTPGGSADEFETPRGRFVNKTRGGCYGQEEEEVFSGAGEIVSLDDLADEFLRARAESEDDEVVSAPRGRSRRESESGSGSGSSARYLKQTESSKQRGRSVSRPPAAGRNQSVGPTRTHYSSVVDRRRATRSNYEIEQDMSHAYNPKPATKRSSTGGIRKQVQKQPNLNCGMTRSTSHKDLFHSHDSSSSTHSSLTDDEARDARLIHINKNEKTIREVYPPEKEHLGSENETGLYEAMRNEVRNAVEEIRTQLEKVVAKTEPAEKNGSDDLKPVQVIAELRRNYTSKLEESEKRKQELLAELAAEEQRGQELTKIVKELLPSQNNKVAGRQSRARRRSKERSKVSRHLTEEAERYFEDFLSNVDDTDFSSFDEERSDTSSIRKGFVSNPYSSSSLVELQETPVAKSSPLSPVTDGVVLPWLQWETGLQTSPIKPKPEAASAKSHDFTTSSHASWSPEYGSGSDASISKRKPTRSIGQVGNCTVSGLVGKIKGSSYHEDEYLDLRIREDFILERMRQRQRIESGSLILCERIML